MCMILIFHEIHDKSAGPSITLVKWWGIFLLTTVKIGKKFNKWV